MLRNRDYFKKFRNTTYFKGKRFAFYGIKEKICSVLLHGFCDRSNRIYEAVIYLRIVTDFGVRVSFLTSKTKVIPSKKIDDVSPRTSCGYILE